VRIRHAIVFLAIALLSASAASDEPLVVLPIEPELEAPAVPTLESAARANDFPTFDALYRANPDPAFRTLHELWTYSMTERAGAFYGADVYGRLSGDYPAYAEFIADHRIVDGNGEAFYPVSETRAFLLEQRAPAERAAERTVRSAAVRDAAVRGAAAPAAVTPATRRPGAGDTAGEAPAPQRAPAPAPVAAEELALLTTVVSEPAVVKAAEPAPAPITAPTAPAPPKGTNRGLLLVIIGLVGVGLLALIVRAPREVIP
jgi:hypothetical protein